MLHYREVALPSIPLITTGLVLLAPGYVEGRDPILQPTAPDLNNPTLSHSAVTLLESRYNYHVE